MRLAERTDYALRVLMFLATSRQQATVTDMATHFRVSRNHLVKVVQLLAELGLVRTTRGRGGGVTLSVDPAHVKIGNLVAQVEPDMGLVECMRPSGACPLTDHCRLASLIDDARRAFIDALNSSTLADLAATPEPFLRSLGVELTTQAG